MKQSLKQIQKQSLALTPTLQNQIKLLSLTGEEIRSQLFKLLDQLISKEDQDRTFHFFKDIVLIDKYNQSFNKSTISPKKEFEIIQEESLKELLLNQLSQTNLKEHEYLVGEYLIDSIQDTGRLDNEIDFEDIKSMVKNTFGIAIKLTDIEKILNKIQNMEPIGCGYRSITESLIVQVQNLDITLSEKDNIEKTLIKISNGKLKLENLTSKEKRLIRHLNFNPGNGIGRTDKNYLTPDVIAFQIQGVWEVSLNDSYMSETLIKHIKTALNKSSLDIKQEAKSFIKGFERRQQTLLLVSKHLVYKQRKFLNGEGNLVPITLSQIAKSINSSESTISRIVSSKYLQLPKNSIPLSNLLERNVTRSSEKEKEISPSQLKQLIKNILNWEDKSQLLSDEKIRLLLEKKYAINISRRTVCKYRILANIGSSGERISI